MVHFPAIERTAVALVATNKQTKYIDILNDAKYLAIDVHVLERGNATAARAV